MKICKIILRGFRQFEDTELDFTNPETGEPVEKICLIGKNGTGKSTILNIINRLVIKRGDARSVVSTGFIATKLKMRSRTVYLVSLSRVPLDPSIFEAGIENEDCFVDDFSSCMNPKEFHKLIAEERYQKYALTGETKRGLKEELALQSNSNDLAIYSPAETAANSILNIGDVPQTNVDAALKLMDKFNFYHKISNETVNDMWKTLVYLIKKRDSERHEFENRPENLKNTKLELNIEFDQLYPQVLPELAKLWNRILGPAGLELDVDGANNPIQLNDNLKAYIRHNSTKEKIGYNQLSTGIRNFIFRIGHLFLLYFNREIKRGFLLVDEPENTLFPDFLFDLMDTYVDIVSDSSGETNTQMFFATHNPIVAAQFEPYERIVLEWNQNGSVIAKKGRAPTGCDPNEILETDFELPQLLGREGQKKWKEYIELRKRLRRSQDENEKDELVSKAAEIGVRYNFPGAQSGSEK